MLNSTDSHNYGVLWLRHAATARFLPQLDSHRRGCQAIRAFTDPSGGSDDSFALAISHKSEDRIVIDAIREARPPFSPDAVVDDFTALLKSYRVSRVTGDRYAGEFPRELFRKHGIAYELAKQTKSELFRDLLPLLNSGRIVLPRNDRLHGPNRWA